MKQLVTFFILTIIFYYTTLFLGRCISSEYKKIKVREFVEGFEELSKDKKKKDKKKKGKIVEGMGVIANRRRRQRANEAARRKALDNQAKLITGIVAAQQTKAQAMLTEADAKKQEAINEGKEIERKQAADEARADFQKEFLADDGDDGSGEFFEDQSPDFFKRDPSEQPAPENEEQIKMAFEYKQKQLEEQEEIARNSKQTMIFVVVGIAAILLIGIIGYFLFIRKKGGKPEVKTSSSTPKVEVSAPKVEAPAPKVEAPAPKS
mgnify:CR=1 FL=1